MMRIGLEIHVQLPTKSKLFCSDLNDPSAEPNTNVCPICLGMPGSKPSLNMKALELAVIAAKTLNCQLLDTVWFSRKTYFYPDLSKNFQITQFEAPIAVEGYLETSQGRVNIWRIHIEEDPARAVHELIPDQECSLLDYNRSGVPLIEIVTAPDMLDPTQAREFLRLMLNELRYVGVIAEGGELKIRADANISVTDGERVEIKNITGLKNLEKALDFEFHRQSKVSGAGIEIKRETRGFDEDRGVTTGLREKEEEQEYGYIFEPDLPVYDLKQLSENMIIPETASMKAAEIEERNGIDAENVKSLLLNSKPLGELLEEISERIDPKRTFRWLSTAVKAEYNRHPERDLHEISAELERVISAEADGKITDVVAKTAIKRIFESGKAGELTEMDEGDEELTQIVTAILSQTPGILDDIKKNPNATNSVVGKVIKQTKGRYDPREIVSAIKKQIE